MSLKSILLVFLITVSTTISLIAQTGSIRGFVYLKGSGEPAIFTNVFLKGTTYGASTDDNGFFNLSKIPLGKYTVIATAIGYDSAISTVELVKAGQIIDQKLYVGESTVDLETVTISAERQEAQTQVKMSVTKLTPKDIKKMPAIGGDPDLAQYLQVLPGVVFTGDQGGQLYIRGGSPIQNKVLLDGMVIYNPFHSIGLFSVFDTDVLRTADVYTGGYSAEYGGRISSIMDIKTIDGNKQRVGGKIGATTFGADVMVEGPIVPSKGENSGSKTFVLSAKNSYLDRSSQSIYNYIDTIGLPYNFTDLYGKISLNANNGSKVNFFGFNYKDEVRYPNIASFEWNQYGAGTNFVLIPGRSTTLIDGTIAYSNYETSAIEEEETATARDRRSSIDGFNMAINFTNFNGDNESKFGFEILGFTTDFEFENSVSQTISQKQNTTEIAGYLQYTFNIGKLVFEPSFRVHYYAALSAISPEPRVGFKYNLTDNLRIKGAGGFYSQNFISATSDRDVVNLFYGFLSGPDNLQREFTDENGNTRALEDKLQKARHAILGFEYDLNRNFNVNVEGYYKRFNQLTNVNRNKLYDENDILAQGQPEVLVKDYIVETGDAYGIDFTFKYERKQMSLYAVYSLSKVERYDGIQTYFPIFDRRHNVNLVGSYTFGDDLNWTVDARWNLGSGFPLTQTNGFYELLTFQGGLDEDYVSTNGELGIRYADLNQGRMPWYHRFDLSVKRKFLISEHSELDATISVTNIYNRENIFYVNRVTSERVNQLPILPSAGVSLTF